MPGPDPKSIPIALACIAEQVPFLRVSPVPENCLRAQLSLTQLRFTGNSSTNDRPETRIGSADVDPEKVEVDSNCESNCHTLSTHSPPSHRYEVLVSLAKTGAAPVYLDLHVSNNLRVERDIPHGPSRDAWTRLSLSQLHRAGDAAESKAITAPNIRSAMRTLQPLFVIGRVQIVNCSAVFCQRFQLAQSGELVLVSLPME